MAIGFDINWIFGDQKTPAGMVNSELAGATWWITSQTHEKEINQQAQTWAITTPGLDSNVPSPTSWNPKVDVWTRLSQITKPQYQLAGFDADAVPMINVTEQVYPNLNDNTLSMIQSGKVPTTKKANSWIWLARDLGMNDSDMNLAIQTISSYLPTLKEKWQVIVNELNMHQQNLIKASQSWDQATFDEALAKMKIAVGDASKMVANDLYSKDKAWLLWADAQSDMSRLYSINRKAEEFLWFYKSDWASLQNYINKVLTPVTRQYQAKATQLDSTMAKSRLKQNPFYVRLLQSQAEKNPIWYKKLVSDYNVNRITPWEKEFIQSMKTKISAISDQKRNVAEQYGWDTANQMYAWYDDLFELLTIDKKTYMDDIMDNFYESANKSSDMIFGGLSSKVF
jgi:hypothetical protein